MEFRHPFIVLVLSVIVSSPAAHAQELLTGPSVSSYQIASFTPLSPQHLNQTPPQRALPAVQSHLELAQVILQDAALGACIAGCNTAYNQCRTDNINNVICTDQRNECVKGCNR